MCMLYGRFFVQRFYGYGLPLPCLALDETKRVPGMCRLHGRIPGTRSFKRIVFWPATIFAFGAQA